MVHHFSLDGKFNSVCIMVIFKCLLVIIRADLKPLTIIELSQLTKKRVFVEIQDKDVRVDKGMFNLNDKILGVKQVDCLEAVPFLYRL